MAGRRRRARHESAVAFRPSAPPAAGRTPSRRQTVALLCGLVLVAAGIAAVSYLVKPAKARSFKLFYGSVYVDDDVSPVAIDLASGKPTVKLRNAYTAVSAKSGSDVDVYPLAEGYTLLLDRDTGEFNMVDGTGFVVKPSDGGVRLPKAGATTTATAVASGSSAYIMRTSSAGTSVYLVSASTVASAIGAPAAVKPRGYAALKQPVAGDAALKQQPSEDSAPAAAANGSLWALTQGPGRSQDIVQLSVPAASNPGVTLTRTGHGTVSGPAALTAATRHPDGSGGDVPVVATSSSLRLFGGGRATTVHVNAGSRVRRILAASNAPGAAVFLYQSARGWSEVAVRATGGPATVHRLRAIPASADLIPPGLSNQSLYTMDRSGGHALWQIGLDGTAERVPGAPRYPLLPLESPRNLTSGQVVAAGSRVIFNFRNALEAMVVYTDGSQHPRVITKHSAVAVDPSGATTLANAHLNGSPRHGKTSKHPPKTVKHPAQTVNDKINCKTAQQVPRIPILVAGDRAARSISVSWIYNRLDPTDCYPSTYVVRIKVLSSGAPSPPSGQVTVQGQNGVTLTNLFPATEYELTVTAYINTKGTQSAPIRVTTGPEGPAAPTDVRASADSSGNWTVSWKSCGGVQQGCVPSTNWYVIPSYCGVTPGLSAVPPKVTVPGDPTAHSFTRVYRGSDAMLGRALCFQVQGVSPQGTIGTTSASTAPAYSWTTPDAGALALHASQPADTAFGATTTTTVDLDLGSNPVRDVGGTGATIALRLTGPDGSQSKTVNWDGRQDRIATVFDGIRAGARYTATATVAPPRHDSSAVHIGPVDVTTRSNWPPIDAQVSCPTAGGPVTLGCTLTVQLSGPSSAQANGERFDLVDSGLVCGNAGFALTAKGIDPAHDVITQNVDLLQYNGTCTVNIKLAEAGATSGPEVFGGTTSPLVTRSVDLGHASSLDAGQADFTASWVNDQGASGVAVKYQGPRTDDQVGQLTYGWQETLLDPNGNACGSSTRQPTHAGIVFDADAGCVNDQGDTSGWRATVTYSDKSNGVQHTFSYALSGTPPSYTPCTVTASAFQAAWAADGSENVVVGFDPTGTDLRGCSDWQLTVNDAAQSDCGDSSATPNPSGVTIPVKNSCTPTLGYTVSISYRDPAHRAHSLAPVAVNGTPPAPPPSSPSTSPTPSPSSS